MHGGRLKAQLRRSQNPFSPKPRFGCAEAALSDGLRSCFAAPQKRS
ncbi:hypothetical protein HMPREF9123_0513 [Neisseria bacilliformis ATCC BAA-1200]|uniref:Uncharacterized protein n=1 Tax=Neisseria bacilliformis ATCC BAA-1200 TaxID=888742 RepID=F2B9V9_9NEIS|nr:hypothetical protein HMPREF9123_0513 [Neisseria bacilliformis ATCC BAA-1200]